MGSFGSKQSQNLLDSEYTQKSIKKRSQRLEKNTSDLDDLSIQLTSQETLRTASPSLQSQIINLENMPVQKKCIQCGMAFPNDEALSKHKTRFCIGVKDSGIGRKVNYSADSYPRPNKRYDRPPSTRRDPKYQSQLEKVIFNLYMRTLRLSFDRCLKDKKRTKINVLIIKTS